MEELNSMAPKSFVILYTKQTKKKHKVWHDGTLKFTSQNKGILYDDKGIRLDSVFVKDDVQIGDQLESDYYLITIEKVLSSNEQGTISKADQVLALLGRKKTIPSNEQSFTIQGRTNPIPKVMENCPRQNRVGLKRQGNNRFVPPLLRKNSTEVNNQREVSANDSNRFREIHESGEQSSYQHIPKWNPLLTKRKFSYNVSSSDQEPKIDNQAEIYSSKGHSVKNYCTDFQKTIPAPPAICPRTITRLNEVSPQFNASNQFLEGESIVNKPVGSQVQSYEEPFICEEKSTGFIARTGIQIHHERRYRVNDVKVSGIQDSFGHFSDKTTSATITNIFISRKDCAATGLKSGNKSVSNPGELISPGSKFDFVKREINSEDLLKNKNQKRTASQIMALLKSSTNENSPNSERMSEVRNSEDSLNKFCSKGISTDSKIFSCHSNDPKKTFCNSKPLNTQDIHQNSLVPTKDTFRISDIPNAKHKEYLLSESNENNSKLIQSDIPLDENSSPDLNFNLKNVGSLIESDSTAQNEQIDQTNKPPLAKECCDSISNVDKNDSLGKNVFERTSLVSQTVEMNSEDKGNSCNIPKTSLVPQTVEMNSEDEGDLCNISKTSLVPQTVEMNSEDEGDSCNIPKTSLVPQTVEMNSEDEGDSCNISKTSLVPQTVEMNSEDKGNSCNIPKTSLVPQTVEMNSEDEGDLCNISKTSLVPQTVEMNSEDEGDSCNIPKTSLVPQTVEMNSEDEGDSCNIPKTSLVPWTVKMNSEDKGDSCNIPKTSLVPQTVEMNSEDEGDSCNIPKISLVPQTVEMNSEDKGNSCNIPKTSLVPQTVEMNSEDEGDSCNIPKTSLVPQTVEMNSEDEGDSCNIPKTSLVPQTVEMNSEDKGNSCKIPKTSLMPQSVEMNSEDEGDSCNIPKTSLMPQIIEMNSQDEGILCNIPKTSLVPQTAKMNSQEEDNVYNIPIIKKIACFKAENHKSAKALSYLLAFNNKTDNLGFVRKKTEGKDSMLLNVDTREINDTLIETENNNTRNALIPTLINDTLKVIHSQDEVDLCKNIVKESIDDFQGQNNKDCIKDSFFLASNNETKIKYCIPNESISTEKKDPKLLNNDFEEDSKTLQESTPYTSQDTPQDTPVTLLPGDAKLSSPINREKKTKTMSNIYLKTPEDILMEENNRVNQNNDPFLIGSTEELDSKESRIIEIEQFDDHCSINKDVLRQKENPKKIEDNRVGMMPSKVSLFSKEFQEVKSFDQIFNKPENSHIIKELSKDINTEENINKVQTFSDVIVNKPSEDSSIVDVSKNVPLEEISENILLDKVPEKVSVKEGPKTTPIKSILENIPVKNIFFEELSENDSINKLSDDLPVKGISSNFQVDMTDVKMHKDVSIEKLSDTFLAEQISEEVGGKTELKDNDIVSITQKISAKEVLAQSKNTYSNFGLSKCSINKKGLFSSLKTCNNYDNNNKEILESSLEPIMPNELNKANSSHVECTTTLEVSSPNDIAVKIKDNSDHPIIPLKNTLLSDSKDHLNSGSSLECLDNSSSSDGLNFDLSFNIEDNSSQEANHKQVDYNEWLEKQGAKTFNLISCLDYPEFQTNENSENEDSEMKIKKEINEIKTPKPSSMNHSVMSSNKNSNQQSISDSSQMRNLPILNFLNPSSNEENNLCVQMKGSVETSRDRSISVLPSPDNHNKDFSSDNCSSNIALDQPLFNQEEIIQDSNWIKEKPSSNNLFFKNKELVFHDKIKPVPNKMATSLIRYFDRNNSAKVNINMSKDNTHQGFCSAFEKEFIDKNNPHSLTECFERSANESLNIRNKNNVSLINKDISERSSFIPTHLTNTTSLDMNPRDTLHLYKSTENNKKLAIDSSFSALDNKTEKQFGPKEDIISNSANIENNEPLNESKLDNTPICNESGLHFLNNNDKDESSIETFDKEKNIKKTERNCDNIFSSSLDELSFSPDSFDNFELKFNNSPYQKEIIPSLNSRKRNKSLSPINILDSPTYDLGTRLLPWDKINASSKTNTDKSRKGLHLKQNDFNSFKPISDCIENTPVPQNSATHRIDQLLAKNKNIQREGNQNLANFTNYKVEEQPIQATEPINLLTEKYEEPLLYTSRARESFDHILPTIDPPNPNLLSRAADLNGYRMQGSVFSNIVKRSRTPRNPKISDLVFQEPEHLYQPSASFLPQENNSSSDMSSIGFPTHRATVSPRMKTWDKDIYNALNNSRYNDSDQIVPGNNDLIYSPNNESVFSDLSIIKNFAHEKTNSPCLFPFAPSLSEFQTRFSESTPCYQNKLSTFEQISNESSFERRDFPDFIPGSEKQKHMKTCDESSLDYQFNPTSLNVSQESCSQSLIDFRKEIGFNHYSNSKQKTRDSPLIPNGSASSLTFDFNLPNEDSYMGLFENHQFVDNSNIRQKKIIPKNPDLLISTQIFSDENNSFLGLNNNPPISNNLQVGPIVISDNENSDLSDCEITSSLLTHTPMPQTIPTDTMQLSSKTNPTPIKSKPFDDRVTHENYNFYHYSSESDHKNQTQSINTETCMENIFSNDQQSLRVLTETMYEDEEDEEQVLNTERETLSERNILFQNKVEKEKNKTKDFRCNKKNSKRNFEICNEQNGIKSRESFSTTNLVNLDQKALVFYPENNHLQESFSTITNNEYDKTQEDDIMNLFPNSSPQLLNFQSEIDDSFNQFKYLTTQNQDKKKLFNESNFEIFNQTFDQDTNVIFDKIPQIENQHKIISPKLHLLSSSADNDARDSNNGPMPQKMHHFVSQEVPQQFMSPLQNLNPLSMQSQCSIFETTNSDLSKYSKNQESGLMKDYFCSFQNPKVHKCEELRFPSQQEVIGNSLPKRKLVIPVTFQNVAEYKNILTSVLKEHLNIILFELSSNYHNSLSKVDLSSYKHPELNTVARYPPQIPRSGNQNPSCNCGLPSKMIQVRKEGKNKGRYFYSCTAIQNKRCKFFQWADSLDSKATESCSPMTPLRSKSPKLCDGKNINIYLRRHGILFYCESVFVRQSPWEKKSKKYQQKYQCENLKDRIYIRLSFKDPSGCFSKDDLWIISKNLDFDSSVTFIARSVFYGPNSSLELQIEPLTGYFPSNWNSDTLCHAILAGNVSTELSCMMNLKEHVSISSCPVISSLLHGKQLTREWTRTMPGFKTPFQCQKNPKYSSHELATLANKYVTFWKLNSGQAKALKKVASMLDYSSTDNTPIVLIHGVFGSGKSFLLAVIVMYLLDVIEAHQAEKSFTKSLKDEKILISSTTNVAVDRILLYLLEFGCNEFIRVGSVKKIAKPILPFSVHATSNDNNDLKELQEMLKEENLSKIEKQYIRKSIEMHKLGLNKKKLQAVKIVGVTCASCSFYCLEKMKFPIVLLDECSQMTEPSSLLPLARFGCEKLLLVGDPMQLDPTIQGSEAENEDGLEQSMFDRLLKMGHEAVLLQRQYRCHPSISQIANVLFYGQQLEDGIKVTDRPKLVPSLPTLCFYDVSEGKEICESSGSFYNQKEADFAISLILALLASGLEPSSIGVIALYKSQTQQISQKMFESWQNHQNKFLKGKSAKSIQVSTVDAFQGGERDVIILSCVRTNHAGFVNNNKRMNVALTRAKNHLFIIGQSRNLCTDQTWSQVIKICQNSSNSFQCAKQAKAQLVDLCNSAQISETEEDDGVDEEESIRSPKRKMPKYHHHGDIN